jgi:hypothetical protein
MFDVKILFKLIRQHLKDRFTIGNLILEYVEDTDLWVKKHLPHLGYHGPVPTYRIVNSDEVAWRMVNIMEITNREKLEILGKMIGNESVKKSLSNCVQFINKSGNVNEYEIPQKTKDEISKKIQNLNGQYFDLPKSNAIKKFIDWGASISFEFSSVFNMESSGDGIDFFITVLDNLVRTPNGEELNMYDIKSKTSNETLFDYLNWEWPEFAEGIFWGIFASSGLIDELSFYDQEIDYIRFYFS